MVRWVVGSILHGVDPLSYFSFQPVLLIDKSSLCGGSGFPFSLSEWSLTTCLTPYNRRFSLSLLCNSGAGRSSEVERSLMVRWVVGSILHGGGPIELFLVPASVPRLV